MFKSFFKLLLIIYILNPNLVFAQGKPADDDIIIEDDDAKKKPEKDNTQTDTEDDTEKKPKPKEIDVDAVVGDTGPKFDETGKDTDPVELDMSKIKKKGDSKRTWLFTVEMLAGPRIGMIELMKNHGLGFDVNAIFRINNYFGININGNFGFIFDADLELYNQLAINLEPRVYIPVKKVKGRGRSEVYLGFRFGYRVQEALIEELKRELTGIDLGASLGVNWYLQEKLHLSWQLSYHFPVWLNNCDTAAGARQCDSARGLNAHQISFLFGIGISF